MRAHFFPHGFCGKSTQRHTQPARTIHNHSIFVPGLPHCHRIHRELTALGFTPTFSEPVADAVLAYRVWRMIESCEHERTPVGTRISVRRDHTGAGAKPRDEIVLFPHGCLLSFTNDRARSTHTRTPRQSRLNPPLLTVDGVRVGVRVRQIGPCWVSWCMIRHNRVPRSIRVDS